MQPLHGYTFQAFASADGLPEAVAVADRCQRALDWLAGIFAERPVFRLFVAGPDDWDRVAAIPLYGMPHAFPGLVVTGTSPADFWRDYAAALLEDLTPEGRRRIAAVYGDPPQIGKLFGGLIVVHELAHLFHEYDEQSGLTDFPRLWLAELFANIGLHGYITENEPEQFAAMQTVCRLADEAPAARWPVTDLNRMEAALADGPLNYVWFQLRLIVIAGAIWDAGGAEAMRAFRRALTGRDLADAEIVEQIAAIAPGAAASLREWPVTLAR